MLPAFIIYHACNQGEIFKFGLLPFKPFEIIKGFIEFFYFLLVECSFSLNEAKLYKSFSDDVHVIASSYRLLNFLKLFFLTREPTLNELDCFLKVFSRDFVILTNTVITFQGGIDRLKMCFMPFTP